jgi:hypothetical protein
VQGFGINPGDPHPNPRVASTVVQQQNTQPRNLVNPS